MAPDVYLVGSNRPVKPPLGLFYACGFGLRWFSPIGPLTFSYALPISEASTDITEKFRFQIGTSF